MKKLLSLALAATAIVAAPAGAQTFTNYNAFSSFNGTTASGNFSYGTYGATGFNAFTQTGSCAIAGTICLQSGNSNVPGVYKTANGTAFQTGSVLVPNDALILHPGTDVATYVLFTVTVPGAYAFSANVGLADVTPTGVTITTFFTVGGTTTFEPTDELTANGFSGGGGFFELPPLFTAGDNLGFLIGNDGDYRYDSTSLALDVTSTTIAAVPEPATWAMMMLGFGMIGFGLRRRSRQAARVTYA